MEQIDALTSAHAYSRCVVSNRTRYGAVSFHAASDRVYIQLGIDEETLEVRAVEVTSSNIGDAPVLPEFLNQIPADQDIGSFTADGAYDPRECHEAIAARGAEAVIPPRKNAKPWKPTSAGAIARNNEVSAQLISGSQTVATLERIPPPKQRRNQNALYEITRSIAHGEGLRRACRGNPSPHCRA